MPDSEQAPPLAESCVDPAAAPALEWQVHRARGRPFEAAVVAGAAVCAGMVCLQLFHSLPFALFSVMAVLAATAEFLFPIRYRLNAEGAELRNLHNWRRIEWEEVKKVYVGEREVKLSPLSRPSRREAFRGVLLQCPDNQEAVLAIIAHYRRQYPALQTTSLHPTSQPTSDPTSRDAVDPGPPAGDRA